MVNIVADIGGTKTRIAIVRDGESFETPAIVDSPESDTELISVITEAIHSAAQGESVEEIIIGKPHWKRKPTFESDLQALLPVPVQFVNDAALVGLGEAHFGTGKESPIFVYITISTGVNGVRIVDGRIDVSTEGFEIGGQYLGLDSSLSLEDMISGRAIHEKYGKHPKELGKDHPAWEELSKITAYGLHNTILHWSPDRVVLGGSMMNEIGIPLERVQFHLDTIMKKFPVLPELAHSALGDVGGLWGGVALLKQKVF